MHGIKIKHPIAFIVATTLGQLLYYWLTGYLSLHVPFFILLMWLTSIFVSEFRYSPTKTRIAKLKLAEGDVLLIKGLQYHEDLRRNLKALKKRNLLIINVDNESDIKTLNEKAMAFHGWYRQSKKHMP